MNKSRIEWVLKTPWIWNSNVVKLVDVLDKIWEKSVKRMVIKAMMMKEEVSTYSSSFIVSEKT